MQLNKQNIKQLIEKNKTFSQMTFDEDYVIKDNKPDVLSIVCAKGIPEVEEIKSSANALWVNGKLNFEIMYRQDGGANLPEVIVGAIPFQEKILVEHLDNSENVKVNCLLDDLTVTIINSRKISIRGIINIESLEKEIQEISLTKSIESSECQQLVETEEFLELRCAKSDVLRVNNEFVIPKSKSNIGKILYDYIDVRNVEATFVGNQLNIQGELYCLIFYISEERETEWYDTTINISGTISCEGANDPAVFWPKINLVQKFVEAEPDYDNEMRQISVQLVFDVDICAWDEEKLEVLKDAYMTNSELQIKRSTYSVDKFLIKNTARNRFAEQIQLDQTDNNIMQICGCRSQVSIEHTEIEENRLNAEGLLTVYIIYISADDGFSVKCRVDQIPFEQQIELLGVSKSSRCKLDAGVDQIQINLLDSRAYEIKAATHIAAIAFDKKEVTLVDEIEEQPAGESCDNIPGIVACVIQKGQRPWDLAKKYKTTVDDICSVNGIKESELTEGKKIVVVKTVKQ